ncbi:MAG: hypothetical protein WCP46_01735 [Alphaproteobacteria bacterium]
MTAARREEQEASARTLDELIKQHAAVLQTASAGAVAAARQEEQAKAELMLEEASSRSELQISALQALTSLAPHPPQRGITLEEVFNQSYRTGGYDPFLNILKAQAIDKFGALMRRFSDGQFLHDAVIVGLDKRPQDHTKEAFIRFGVGVVESLTMQLALEGKTFKAVQMPTNKTPNELTRFTKDLNGFIVNALGYQIRCLRNAAADFFYNEEQKNICEPNDELNYFRRMLADQLMQM